MSYIPTYEDAQSLLTAGPKKLTPTKSDLSSRTPVRDEPTSSVGGDIISYLKGQPAEAERLGKDVLVGIDEFGKGLVNFPHNLGEDLHKYAGMPENLVPDAAIPQNFDLNEALGISSPTTTDRAVQDITQFAPYLMGGELEGATTLPQKALGAAAQGFKYGLTQDNHPIQGASEDALIGAATEPVSYLFPGSSSSLKHAADESVKPGANIRTPEEVAELRKQIGEFNVPIGDWIGDEGMARQYTQQKGKMIGSGVKRQLQKAIGQLNEQAVNSLNTVAGNLDDTDVIDEIGHELANNRDHASSLYNSLIDKAQQAGFKNSHENLIARANQILNDQDKMPMRTISSDLITELKRIPENEQISPDFKDAIAAHSAMNSFYRDKLHGGKRVDAHHVNELLDAMEQDLEAGVNATSNPDLLTDWENARSYYKNNVVPLQDKAVQKVLNDEANENTLYKSLIENTRQNTGKREAVLDVLPQQTRSKLGHNYLKNAMKGGSINSEALYKAFQKIKPSSRSRLFTPSQREEFEKLGAMLNVSKETRKAAKGIGRINTQNIASNMPYIANEAVGHAVGAPTLARLLGDAAIGTYNRIMTGANVSDRAVQRYIKNNPGVLKETAPAALRGLLLGQSEPQKESDNVQ